MFNLTDHLEQPDLLLFEPILETFKICSPYDKIIQMGYIVLFLS